MTSGRATPPGHLAIHFDQVSHDFGARTVLDDVTFEVGSGEFCTIIGPSGCGKTTCLNIIAGEVTATTGAVTVHASRSAPRLGDHRIGYMLARDALFPWRTARRNVELGMEARRVPSSLRRQRAEELLGAVGLAHVVDHHPAQLSQGMRQRVAIARTFALGAEILLMDEPFAALDAQTRIVVQEHLTRLWEEQRSTVVFITHDLTEAILLSDRIILMSSAPGRIRSTFTVDLPRPRHTRALQGSREFLDLYELIWGELEEEFRTS